MQTCSHDMLANHSSQKHDLTYRSAKNVPGQRSLHYPLLWALYLIAFFIIAHCLGTAVSAPEMSSVAGSQLAAVFGIAPLKPAPCADNCAVHPSMPGWSGVPALSPANPCSSLSTNPDSQAGCGFSIDPIPSQTKDADELTAAAPEELPTTSAEDAAVTTTHSYMHNSGDTGW